MIHFNKKKANRCEVKYEWIIWYVDTFFASFSALNLWFLSEDPEPAGVTVFLLQVMMRDTSSHSVTEDFIMKQTQRC